MPRPTRVRSRRAPGAGLMELRRMVCSFRIRLLFDPNQVRDLVDEAAHRRAVLQLADAVELAQAERLDAQAMLGGAAVRALDEADLDGRVAGLGLSHCPGSPRPSCRASRRSAAAS